MEYPILQNEEGERRISRILQWLRQRVAKPATRNIGQQTNRNLTGSTGQQTDHNSTRSAGQQTNHCSTTSAGAQTAIGDAPSVQDQGKYIKQVNNPSYVDYLIIVAVWMDVVMVSLGGLAVAFYPTDYLDLSIVLEEIGDVRGFFYLELASRLLLLGYIVAEALSGAGGYEQTAP
ncbi:hypothetical protein GGR58DRAFT_482824 [Xylaria digitata]|nr:hypothetical protein GGR58DRAFT_482824 [Xylaria digitata]